MKVEIEREGKMKELSFSGSVKELLLKLEINPETVIVARDNELLLEDEEVGGDDTVKILSVVSGG